MYGWTVTRQSQWPTGQRIVEISAGGLDYCNPDALTEKYRHEFETFADAREAVNAAVEIARAWASDIGHGVAIGYGATGGYTMPFEQDARITPSGTRGLRALRRWAASEWARTPKCEECGDALPDERHVIRLEDDSSYCSDRCADRAWGRALRGAEDYN